MTKLNFGLLDSCTYYLPIVPIAFGLGASLGSSKSVQSRLYGSEQLTSLIRILVCYDSRLTHLLILSFQI